MKEGWKDVELSDIAEYGKDKIPFNAVNSLNFISADNMFSDVGGITHSDYTPQKGNVSKFQFGDILVSNIRPYFKKMWYARFDGGCSNDVFVIKSNSENVDSKFLFYNLSQQNFFDFMMAGANGTKMPRGNKDAIIKYKFTLPPFETQRKIAGILSGYDDFIENNLKRIKILEEMAQQTYEEWFIRMRFPGFETAVINEETGLPEGWKKVKLNEIADFQNGYAFYTKGYSESGYVIIDLGNVSEYGDLNISGNEKLISTELYNSLPKFHLKKHDIVIAMTDITSSLRILAKSAIIDKDDTYALNQRVGMLRPNTLLFNYAFLYAILSDYRFIERMKAISKGAVQFYFNTKDIVNYETFLPPKDIIEDFVTAYEPYLKTRMLLKDQNQRLREARDILLPRLMMGMIEV